MPHLFHITSRQHAVVRQFRHAGTRSGAEDVVLLDGEHLLREALAAGLTVRTVLTDGRHGALTGEAERAGAAVYTCTGNVLDAASPVRTPSGVVAIVEWAFSPLSTVLAAQPALVVALVDVQDPGNVGSAIRSADALGATGFVAVGATADPGGWKVLRGSMGSAFRLPIAKSDLSETIAAAHASGARVLATTNANGTALSGADLTSPVLLLFGHEGLGLPPDALARADASVSIPMRAGVDSLNVAVASALVLAEARRQRERRQEPAQ